MRIQFSFWTLFVLPAFAQSDHALPVSGPLKSGGIETAAADQVLEDAGRHPNASSSISFVRTDNGTPGTWVWSVNITTIPVPNDPEELGISSANSSEKLNIVNTQWQLQWPNHDESLQGFLKNSSVYVNALRVSLPSNVTNSYSSQTNGSCSTLLGTACTQSLLQAAVENKTNDYSGLDGCASTLDIGQIDGVGFGISTNNTQSPTLNPGDSLFFYTSEVYSAENLTLFHTAESMVNVLVLSPESRTTEHEDIDTTILCQIVDKTATSGTAPTRCQVSFVALWAMMIYGIVVVL